MGEQAESVIAKTLLDITDPIQFGAEEYWCAMKVLDENGVPRFDQSGKNEYSLVGRINWIINT